MIMDGRGIYRICFVCNGNACRSPFAESVVRTLLRREGIDGIEVFSLGTLDWGVNPRDAMMVVVAGRMGYELTGTTTHMTRKALAAADLVIVFDEQQRNAVTRELDYELWNKIVLFDKIAFGTDGAVADPHYQTETVYLNVAHHIEEGCRHIVELLREMLQRAAPFV